MHIRAFAQGEYHSGGWQCSPQIIAGMWNWKRTPYKTVTVSYSHKDTAWAQKRSSAIPVTWKWFSPQPSVPRPILFSRIDVAHEAVAATDQFCGAQQRFSALQQLSENSKSYALSNCRHM